MAVKDFGLLSKRRELNKEDIPQIVDKAFDVVKPLASTETLYDMKQRLDTKEARGFHFEDSSQRFVYFDAAGQKHMTDPKKVVESGVAICKSKSGKLYYPELKLIGGLSMAFENTCDGHPEDFLGTIHTHPGGLTSPSTADLRMVMLGGERIACIATRYNDYDDGNQNYKRYKTTCLASPSAFGDKEIKEYNTLNQGLLSKYERELFKLSTRTYASNLGIKMRGEVIAPSLRVVKEGNTVKVVEKGTVPFLREQNAREFDDDTRDFLKTYFDIYIEEERKYDEKGKAYIINRKGY